MSISVMWYGGSVGYVSIVRVDVCLSLSGGMWWECGICDSCEGSNVHMYLCQVV